MRPCLSLLVGCGRERQRTLELVAVQAALDRLDDIVVENAERNTEFMKLYFDNPEFQKAIKETARKRAYRIILDPARDEALARLRAEMARETGSGGIQ
jgi:type I restriction enzyme, R subunit